MNAQEEQAALLEEKKAQAMANLARLRENWKSMAEKDE